MFSLLQNSSTPHSCGSRLNEFTKFRQHSFFQYFQLTFNTFFFCFYCLIIIPLPLHIPLGPTIFIWKISSFQTLDDKTWWENFSLVPILRFFTQFLCSAISDRGGFPFPSPSSMLYFESIATLYNTYLVLQHWKRGQMGVSDIAYFSSKKIVNFWRQIMTLFSTVLSLSVWKANFLELLENMPGQSQKFIVTLTSILGMIWIGKQWT